MRVSAQLRAEIESRSAIYYFLGIKGEPFTDGNGRRAAVGRFAYKCTGDEDVEPQHRERIDVEVQVCEDAAGGWQPVGGIAAVRAAALALPAKTGRKKRAVSKAGARARWGDRDRAAEVQAYFDAMGRAPHLDAEKTRAVKAAARETEVSEGHIWRMLKDGAVSFGQNADGNPRKGSR